MWTCTSDTLRDVTVAKSADIHEWVDHPESHPILSFLNLVSPDKSKGKPINSEGQVLLGKPRWVLPSPGRPT